MKSIFFVHFSLIGIRFIQPGTWLKINKTKMIKGRTKRLCGCRQSDSLQICVVGDLPLHRWTMTQSINLNSILRINKAIFIHRNAIYLPWIRITYERALFMQTNSEWFYSFLGCSCCFSFFFCMKLDSSCASSTFLLFFWYQNKLNSNFIEVV